MATRKRRIEPYAPELREKVLAAVRSGRSAEEVSEEFGGKPSAQTIRNWANASKPRAATGNADVLRAEVARLTKVVAHMQRKTALLERLALLNIDQDVIAGVVPEPASPFDVLGTPTE